MSVFLFLAVETADLGGPLINQFLSGATMMCALVAALFFLRFWRKTRDRFFALFALAFGVLAVNRLVSVYLDASREVNNLGFYAVRLIAFVLILIAIIDKNRAGHGPTRS